MIQGGIITLMLAALGFISWLTYNAYRNGKKSAKYDFEESLNKILREDNEELRVTAGSPDHAIADKLRERAAAKRKD